MNLRLVARRERANATRATRTERAVEAARESACRGVRGAKAPRIETSAFALLTRRETQGYSPAVMRGILFGVVFIAAALGASPPALAQDPTGTIEGTVTDKTASAVPGAQVTARHLETGFTRESAGRPGWLLPSDPAAGWTSTASPRVRRSSRRSVQQPIQVTVSQTVRVNVQLELSSLDGSRHRRGGAQLVDTSSNALGRVVTGRELVDLPLNGRNFSQLGLLQTGVAPLTFGVATAGGSLRQGQAYAVNGMRPEQNVYLVDGVQNMNRMDGGYALKVPVDAIAEFRILTQSAPSGIRRHRRRHDERRDAIRRQSASWQPLRLPAQRRLRRAQLLLARRRAAQPAPVRRHDRRSAPRRSRVRVRLLRGLPQQAGRDDHRDGADAAGASRRLFRDGHAAAQLAAGGIPISGKPVAGRGDQPGRAQRGRRCIRSATCRRRSIARRVVGRNRLHQAGGPRRLQRVREQPDVRPLFLLGRPQRQSDLGARHRRPRLSDARRSVDALGAAVEHAHLFAVADELAARVVAALRLLLRSAPEPDAADRARLRLRVLERAGPGAALLQRQRLHADRRRDHRSAQLDADDLRDAGQRVVDARTRTW